MSKARAEFLSNLETIEEASAHEILLNKPLTPAHRSANLRAQLLRRGLIVVAFSTLEQFIRQRVSESLEAVSSTILRFDELPEGIKKAATLGVLNATQTRVKFAKGSGEPYIAMIQEAAAAVSSTSSGSLHLHRFSFVHGASNVSADEISSTLGAYNIRAPWQEITSVADRVGLGALPLDEAYLNAIRLRHKAAHTPSANVEPNDIGGFLRQAVGIAIGFDVVISRASKLIRDGHANFVNNGKIPLASRVTFRFLDRCKEGYREVLPGSSRAIKVSKKLEDGVHLALVRAQKNGDVLVVRDMSKRPTGWTCTDLA